MVELQRTKEKDMRDRWMGWFYLSAKRDGGRLESRLLFSDKEWREFTLTNMEPLNDLRMEIIGYVRKKNNQTSNYCERKNSKH